MTSKKRKARLHLKFDEMTVKIEGEITNWKRRLGI